MKKTLLIVDDEKDQRVRVRETLLEAGRYEVLEARNLSEARAVCAERRVHLILLDRMLGRTDAITALRDQPGLFDAPILLVSGYTDDTIRAEFAPPESRAGIVDQVHKPYRDEELLGKVRKILEPPPSGPDARADLITRYNRTYGLSDHRIPANVGMIRASNVMAETYRLIEAYAPEEAPLLITGETGTGKELAAREAHRLSPRRDEPFRAVNCAAITETLLESALFGHTRSAFTGASVARKGFFREADHGTIFLDEIGDMSPAMQVRLLRVIEYGEIQPVGADRPVQVDVRVIAATHRDLRKQVKARQFREDLYYRLGIMEIPLPRLIDRGNDIPLLIEHFIRAFGKTSDSIRLAPDALDALRAYPWPGNVRELQHVIQSMVARTRLDGPMMTRAFLPRWIAAFEAIRLSEDPLEDAIASACSRIPPEQITKEAMEQAAGAVRRHLLTRLYRHCGGNLQQVARYLRMSRSALYNPPWKIWIEEIKQRKQPPE
jgi:DNA-binding NtrC family response regulator